MPGCKYAILLFLLVALGSCSTEPKPVDTAVGPTPSSPPANAIAPPAATVNPAPNATPTPTSTAGTQPTAPAATTDSGTTPAAPSPVAAPATPTQGILLSDSQVLNLGTVYFGAAPTSGTVIVSNGGDLPVTISAPPALVGAFSTTGLPAAGTTLAGGAILPITINFATSTIGTYSASLQLNSAADLVIVALTGIVVAPPAPTSVVSPNNFSALQSANGQFSLVLQGNDLSEFQSPATNVWSSDSTNTGVLPYHAVMQSDGNLCIYDKNNAYIWCSGSYGQGSPPYTLSVGNNGNIAIADSAGTAIYSTGAVTTP